MTRALLLGVILAAAGCGTEPAWDGDPSKCDRIEEGACLRALPVGAITSVLPWAAGTFGPTSLRGYLVEGTSSGPCENARGCHDGDTMHIWLAPDDGTEYHPCLRPWVLGHEMGHAARLQQRGDSDNEHTDPVWSLWPRHLGEVCFPQ